MYRKHKLAREIFRTLVARTSSTIRNWAGCIGILA